jgi:hypothetical protein
VKLFLFLDDWLLDVKRDIVRRFPAAEPVKLEAKTVREMHRCSILYDTKKKLYRAIGGPVYKGRAFIWESRDGVKWRKTRHDMKTPQRQSFPFESTWFYDRWDKDAKRRYKMVGYPYDLGTRGGPGIMATSPDGVKWEWHPECVWLDEEGYGSDTNNTMFYNPLKKEWTVICRRFHADRRVALVHSKDLVNWSEAEVVLHPDNADPAMLQFYGMTAMPYEDQYFFGIVQGYQPPVELVGRVDDNRIKMDGKVTPQLVYSYDGRHWLRSDRSAVIQRARPGEVGASCIYPHSIVKSPDGGLYVYSCATTMDHGSHALKGHRRPTEGMLLHRFRSDGFSYLEPSGGWGYIATRVVVPKAGELKLNYLAPTGEVLVQLSARDGKALPGFSFEDCVPLTGDKVRARVQWKRRKNLKSVLGKPLRVEIKMRDARLYALRLDCGLWYTATKCPVEGL